MPNIIKPIMAIIFSPYVISFCIAWSIAHSIKFVISKKKKEKHDIISYLFASGGMPSAHSATVVSLATVVGLRSGFESDIFALAALVSIITMYDALMVRRSSGEQGLAICNLIKEQKSNVKLPKVAMGHKPMEVLAGLILGIVVGTVVFLATHS